MSLATHAQSCQALASAQNEPMLGTADQVDIWIALEYRGDWHAQALADNGLPAASQVWLRENLRALVAAGRRPRALLIRQDDNAGTPDAGLRLLMAVHQADSARLLSFQLADADTLHALDLSRCLCAVPPQAQLLTQPQYLVCTNARRDACCGRLGVPLYQALRAKLGDRVWQCTHLGGHRFAANLLSLPDMSLYGRLQVPDLDAFLTLAESGGSPARWLRGRSWYPNPVQAAETLLGELPQRARWLDQQQLGDAHWAVTFDVAGQQRQVQVTLGAPLQVQASCEDARIKPVRPYQALAG